MNSKPQGLHPPDMSWLRKTSITMVMTRKIQRKKMKNSRNRPEDVPEVDTNSRAQLLLQLFGSVHVTLPAVTIRSIARLRAWENDRSSREEGPLWATMLPN